MTALDIINIYISFFEKRGHKKILNSPLVPENDPTTLFTSSGMQPLIPYLLGETHESGKRLVNVQNCLRAVDIDEVGDNRHTTFFRMLGNWSLGDYFKQEQIPWIWEFLTKELGLPKEKLFITVFNGYNNIDKDNEAYAIWKDILEKENLDLKNKIFWADVSKNWWSRSGTPDKMPVGEIGGPDSEIYFKFDDIEHQKECLGDNPAVCECGKFLEIANSVFIQYQRQENGDFKELSQKNVDFGGGVERMLAAVENKSDIFQTSLLQPIIKSIEKITNSSYKGNEKEMRIIVDHLISANFIIATEIYPSNKDQGYVLRKLIRRAVDYFSKFGKKDIREILLSIAEQYKDTDSYLVDNDFEKIVNTILEECDRYNLALSSAKKYIEKQYPTKAIGDELMGEKEISAQDAFILYTTHGLSPVQIKSLGYIFDEQKFANLMKSHQSLSRYGSEQKFKGGLADHQEKTIMGHTATHLLQQSLKDILGEHVHQTGSNITTERVRFDFNYEKKLTNEEIKKVEDIVNNKIEMNLPVHFEILSLKDAKDTGAIGLFDEKYQEKVKVYFIGNYSKELCGGPHVDFTGKLKRFKIIKQENIGNGKCRLYATVGE